MINEGAMVFAQVKSSTFFSTYDARELVKNRKYKGIDFGQGEMATGTSFSELPGERNENNKSISYDCRIQTTGDDAFNVANFLDWLAQESIKQIESAKATVVGQRHKAGKRFHIEYAQDGFTGRLEVYADITGKDQMSLDVEIIESSTVPCRPGIATAAHTTARPNLQCNLVVLVTNTGRRNSWMVPKIAVLRDELGDTESDADLNGGQPMGSARSSIQSRTANVGGGKPPFPT
ncbi:MAG TPA: hypothetical protein VIV66_05040 [Pyrinomonadaceae bacterium]